MTTTATPVPSKRSFLSGLVLLLVPLLLLAGVIALFVFTKGAGLNVTPAAPIESLQFERTILGPGRIELHLRNTSPQEITIAQININDATWPYTISPGNTIARLGTAVLVLQYPWVQAEAYEITVFSSNSIPLKTSIPVATTTATASGDTLWSFTLIGIYVGIIPWRWGCSGWRHSRVSDHAP
jgi:ZIP family zinc transporter